MQSIKLSILESLTNRFFNFCGNYGIQKIISLSLDINVPDSGLLLVALVCQVYAFFSGLSIRRIFNKIDIKRGKNG